MAFSQQLPKVCPKYLKKAKYWFRMEKHAREHRLARFWLRAQSSYPRSHYMYKPSIHFGRELSHQGACLDWSLGSPGENLCGFSLRSS